MPAACGRHRAHGILLSKADLAAVDRTGTELLERTVQAGRRAFPLLQVAMSLPHGIPAAALRMAARTAGTIVVEAGTSMASRSSRWGWWPTG
ncbi:hypothetical protein ACFRI7_07520 [Streptomyces sp. NPDC056716]|uniref:hypothetical protein n=1 Tax=unclassified Streptomyces TaxID=2593676 RepID=UPI0036818EAF